MSTPDVPCRPEDDARRKIVSAREALRERVEDLKRRGLRVVFTNGAFDLLHVGHVRSLKHARSLGDHLVVAINSDDYVRRTKGAHRPLFPEDERAELVASLSCVDTVHIFNEDTADALIDLIEPHVHAKGPDYALKVPEGETTRARGVEFRIVGDPKDHSSTLLQSRLRAFFAAESSGGPPRREPPKGIDTP